MMSPGHVRFEERCLIGHLAGLGLSRREIGRQIGRHHTTVSRELARNQGDSGGGYCAKVAQGMALDRRCKPRHRRFVERDRLRRWVAGRLQRRWSPEQICGRLVLDFPDDVAMRACPETIYRWVYRGAVEGGKLHRFLRRGHAKRRRQKRFLARRGAIAGRVGIACRPHIVMGRGRFGDWEADSVVGRPGTGGIASYLERRSRYLVTAKLNDGTAQAFVARICAAQTIRAFGKMPRNWRHTSTADNGSEFAAFRRIENSTGLTFYFADAYAAWQRGANENVNGLLRQYFPKGSDFRKITAKQLAKATSAINRRPRKCLGYRTPLEILKENHAGALEM